MPTATLSLTSNTEIYLKYIKCVIDTLTKWINGNNEKTSVHDHSDAWNGDIGIHDLAHKQPQVAITNALYRALEEIIFKSVTWTSTVWWTWINGVQFEETGNGSAFWVWDRTVGRRSFKSLIFLNSKLYHISINRSTLILLRCIGESRSWSSVETNYGSGEVWPWDLASSIASKKVKTKFYIYQWNMSRNNVHFGRQRWIEGIENTMSASPGSATTDSSSRMWFWFRNVTCANMNLLNTLSI